MITEFAAVAGIGELYGISRNLTLPLAASTLLVIILFRSYRRVERAAILIGSFELAFLLIAATTRPDFATVARDVVDIPISNNDFWFLGAALIGAVLNPWMVFYQQSATAEKQLGHRHYSAARGDTALGAVLTQLVSASAREMVCSASDPASLADCLTLAWRRTPKHGPTPILQRPSSPGRSTASQCRRPGFCWLVSAILPILQNWIRLIP
jgi:Mn2+/Fe2+ NRAMP family transporter